MASPTDNPPADRHARHARRAQMRAELAELTLSAAQRLHDRLQAAESSAEAAEMSLAFQRVSRSLRQTLLLETKFERDLDAAGQAQVDRSAASRAMAALTRRAAQHPCVP